MRYFLILGSFLFILSIKGQSVTDFKKKSSTNSVSRTAMLDLMRTSVKKEINQDVVFVVNHFLVSGNYAWLEATAQSKISGKELRMPDDGYDCCGVQALFVKREALVKAEKLFNLTITSYIELHEVDAEIKELEKTKKMLNTNTKTKI